MTNLESLKEDKQKEFRNLIELLNKLRVDKKITAEEWRNYSKRWKDYPGDRKIVINQLELLDSKQSSKY